MTLKTLKHKVSGLCSGEDRGVSPVIGVVLMVAITVILAAVIGAFVLGLGDDLGSQPGAAVSIDSDYVTLQSLDGGADGIAIVDSDGNIQDNTSRTGDRIALEDNSDRVVAYTGEVADTNATIDDDTVEDYAL